MPVGISGSVERGAGLFGECSKSGGVVDCEVRKNLAIDFDAGLLEAVHKDTVAHVVLTRTRVDADDPQLAEIALLVLAIAIGVDPSAFDGLLRGSHSLLRAPKAPRAAFMIFFLRFKRTTFDLTRGIGVDLR